MIAVTRTNHEQLLINSDLIEMAEANPDTVLTFTNGEKLIVAESPEEIVERIVAFRRRIQGLSGRGGHVLRVVRRERSEGGGE